MITLADRIVFNYLTPLLSTSNLTNATLTQILGTSFTATDITNFTAYFTQHPITVTYGYPQETSNLPMVAVVGSSQTTADDFVGSIQELTIGTVGTTTQGTESDIQVMNKTVRVIALADSFLVASVVSAIAFNYMIAGKVAFSQNNLMNMNLDIPEFDLLTKYLPQNLFNVIIRATFQVPDLIQTQIDTTIQKITITADDLNSKQIFTETIT